MRIPHRRIFIAIFKSDDGQKERVSGCVASWGTRRGRIYGRARKRKRKSRKRRIKYR